MPFGQPGFLWRVPDAHIAMRGLVMAPLLILLVGGTEAFRICAFNAHRLTLAKLTKESVMDTLVQFQELQLPKQLIAGAQHIQGKVCVYLQV